jgi:hypothetical protein
MIAAMPILRIVRQKAATTTTAMMIRMRVICSLPVANETHYAAADVLAQVTGIDASRSMRPTDVIFDAPGRCRYTSVRLSFLF